MQLPRDISKKKFCESGFFFFILPLQRPRGFLRRQPNVYAVRVVGIGDCLSVDVKPTHYSLSAVSESLPRHGEKKGPWHGRNNRNRTFERVPRSMNPRKDFSRRLNLEGLQDGSIKGQLAYFCGYDSPHERLADIPEIIVSPISCRKLASH